MKKPPDEETLLKAMLGPTGNLRAPIVRRGQTLIVGFNDGAYAEFLA
jgi:arsenate reductase-like glutaredoxin family protein